MCPICRMLSIGLLVCAAAGCTALPTAPPAVRYCSVQTFEPCLDQVRTGNCQPCPGSH